MKIKETIEFAQDLNALMKGMEEDLSNRLIHYNAIKTLTKKIFKLPQEGNDFISVRINNEFKMWDCRASKRWKIYPIQCINKS